MKAYRCIKELTKLLVDSIIVFYRKKLIQHLAGIYLHLSNDF